jgi:hypothetical protein
MLAETSDTARDAELAQLQARVETLAASQARLHATVSSGRGRSGPAVFSPATRGRFLPT